MLPANIWVMYLAWAVVLVVVVAMLAVFIWAAVQDGREDNENER